MNILRFCLCLLFAVSAQPLFAQGSGCNSSYFLIDNSNGAYNWTQTFANCYPGEFDLNSPPATTIAPGTVINSKANGEAINGFACELTYARADNQDIKFSIIISQDYCVTSSTNSSTVQSGNQYILLKSKISGSGNNPGDAWFVISQ